MVMAPMGRPPPAAAAGAEGWRQSLYSEMASLLTQGRARCCCLPHLYWWVRQLTPPDQPRPQGAVGCMALRRHAVEPLSPLRSPR